jgi:hypothetical protein
MQYELCSAGLPRWEICASRHTCTLLVLLLLLLQIKTQPHLGCCLAAAVAAASAFFMHLCTKKKDYSINEVVIAISHPDQWGFWEWLGQTPRLV